MKSIRGMPTTYQEIKGGEEITTAEIKTTRKSLGPDQISNETIIEH